jgi:hypothetical protein
MAMTEETTGLNSGSPSGEIELINSKTLEELHELYSQMLATAHDIGYKVPDELLLETEDADKLREVIPPLNSGIVEFSAGLDQPRKGSKKKTTAEGTTNKVPKPRKRKEERATEQADALGNGDQNIEDTEMATNAKSTKKATPAKKAKKGVAKKSGKKAASANARTPVARPKHGEKATIRVSLKENPTRKGTERHKRIEGLMKSDGKLVSDYLAKGGRSDTLLFASRQGWVKIVG